MRSLLAVFAAIALGVVSPSPASAHSDLQQAEPAPGASVPAAPAALRLRFSEPLDLSATRIVVTDERGARVDSGELALGPPSDRAATVSLADDLGQGVYTVRWATLSQVDGHRWQGTYRFGVGRAPPAADEAASPFLSLPELLVRWLALAATAVVVGGLAVRTWALEPAMREHPDPQVSARAAATLRLGLWLLALASVGELVASFGLLAGEPTASLGKVGALALLRLALVPMIGYLVGPSGSPGMALAFAAILALARGQAAHAAAYGFLPVLLDAAHQLVAAVWVGGALTIAVLLPALARSGGAARIVVRRFARVALGAAGLALVTGVVNGWALGLEPARLLESRYGQVLAGKLALVVGLIGAAALVWRRVDLAAGSRLVLLPIPLLAELALAAAVLLAAAAVALLPPPGETGRGTLELVRPLQRLQVHLLIESIRTGDLRAVVGLVGPDGASSPATGQVTQVYLTPLDLLDGPGLGVEDLSTPAAGELQAALTRTDGGGLTQSAALDRRGWWRITVGVNAGQGAMFVPFEVLVPDPNRAGLDPPVTDAHAERLFARTLERMEALTAVRQRDLLNDGSGTLIATTTEYVAPDRARLLTDDGEESLTVGNVQVVRRPGEAWRPARRATPLRFPLYRSTYEGATGQRLGYTEIVERVRARVLTFYVPRDRAWYCWWVGLEDGLVHREVMIAPSHYMASRLDAFDRPADVTLP